MGVKFFFFVLLVCLAQEYHAKGITGKFQLPDTNFQVVNHRDNFEEFINRFKVYFKNLDIYSYNCYLHHVEGLKAITEVFAEALKELGTDCEEYFAGKIGENLNLLLNTMADLIETSPDVFYGLIKEKQYKENIMYLNEVWLHFSLLEDQFLAAVKQFKEKNYDLAIKIEEIYKEIREGAKSDGIYDYEEFQKCLKYKLIR